VALIATPASTDVDWFDALGVRVFSYRDDPAAADPHRMELTNGIDLFAVTSVGMG
jgi:hypothetical protein